MLGCGYFICGWMSNIGGGGGGGEVTYKFQILFRVLIAVEFKKEVAGISLSSVDRILIVYHLFTLVILSFIHLFLSPISQVALD